MGRKGGMRVKGERRGGSVCVRDGAAAAAD